VEQRLLDEFKAAQMWESMLVEIPVEFSPVESDHLEIGGYAFFRCVALLDLDFDKLEIIGSYAFGRCKSPRPVNFPSVTRIGECAFHSCVALTDAVFGEELGRIEEGAFWNCPSLRRIVIPLNEDLVVEDSAFRYCDNLSRVDIVGRIHGTISSLHMESWKDTMKEEIGRINTTQNR
jgi:hypothetical protein